MGCGAYRITHVMQTIKHGDQVEVLARKFLGFRNSEHDSSRESLPSSGCAGALDGSIMIVKSEELRFWKGFGHQQGRRSLAAAHVGNLRAGLQLGLNSLQRRNPRSYKISR